MTVEMKRWRYLPELLATPVPRYTSFPTAAEFHENVGAQDMVSALGTIEEGAAISLYLHVPFCRELCWYCGCNTGAANRRGRLAAYVQRLSAEISLLADRIGRHVRISRIAWGGGSPNALDPRDFLALTGQLMNSFDCAGATTSVELDPRAFGGAWAGAIETAGVTRASLGVQTFSPRLQALIGRIQPDDMIEATVRSLRQAGVTSINFDLMYGLPGQSLADLSESIRRTLGLMPERLAVFGYAHVPHLLPRQRRIDGETLPDEEMRFRQAERAALTFRATGYVPVGFDHFARPSDELAVAALEGKLRRNFQGFTEDPANVLIGLGASAISEFPKALLQNEKNSGRYQIRVASGQFATARGIWRSPSDEHRASIIEQLLCGRSASLASLSDFSEISARLAPFLEHALVDFTDGRLTIAPEGTAYGRAIASLIDPYRAHGTTRFSSAV